MNRDINLIDESNQLKLGGEKADKGNVKEVDIFHMVIHNEI
jgi:hypothetical protein